MGQLFKSFKGRVPELGMQVFVYRNLRNGKWSLRCTETNLVICHADEVVLSDCTFKVNEAGRQRVLATREKNVHAGVVGTLESFQVDTSELPFEVTYNPYKYSSFVLRYNEQPIQTSDDVWLTESRVYAV